MVKKSVQAQKGPRAKHLVKRLDRTNIGTDLGGAATARSLNEAVLSRLRDDILSCRLLPGERLNVAELTEKLNVSHGAIREAASRLTSEGLVVAEPQKGFAISSISPADLVDLTRTRCQIEAQCLERAIEVGDVVWETSIVASHHMLSRAPLFADADRRIVSEDWSRAHRRFHEALVGACDSPWLLRLRGTLYLHSERYRRLTGPLARKEREIDREHGEIVEAVLARDADRACKLLVRHIETTTRILLQLNLVSTGSSVRGVTTRKASATERRIKSRSSHQQFKPR